MAYVAPEEEEENQEEQQGSEQVISGQSGQIDAGSGQGSGGASAPQSGGQSPKGTRGATGWTNLQNYVSANAGADSAMGGRLKGRYDQEAGETTAATESFKTSGEKTIDESTVRDAGVVGALNNVGTDQPAQPAGGAPARSLSETQFATDFTKQLGGYQGPGSTLELEGFGDTERGVTDTVGLGQQAQDFEGRRALLRQEYQDPRYSAGEQRLDSFLVGGGAGGKAALSDINQSATTLGKGWEGLVHALQGGLDQARTTSDQVAADTRTAFEGATGRVREDLDTAAAAAEAKNEHNAQRYRTYEENLRSGDPAKVAAALNAIGADPAALQAMLARGLDPALLASAGGAIKIGDVAREGDVANWGALGDLARLGGLEALPTYDFSKSGFDGSAFDVDETLIGNAETAYGLQTALEQRLKDQQAARDWERDSLFSQLGSFDQGQQAAAGLGISAEDYAFAIQNGLNPADFVTGGAKLGIGDVATNDERQQWADLLASLPGFTSDINLMDLHNEGAAYTFNNAGFANALEAARQQVAANVVKPSFPGAAPPVEHDLDVNDDGYDDGVGYALK